MDLQAYYRALRKYWWLVILSTLVGSAIALVITLRATPIHASSVEFFAATPTAEDSSPLQNSQFGQQRVNTYVQLLSSERLAERVQIRTGLDLSTNHLMNAIEGKADLNTVLFTATVRDSQPQQSLQVVEAVAIEFPDLVNDIESQNGTREAPVTLEVVSGPTLKPFPVSPNKKIDVALGFLVGLLLGIGLALAKVFLDRTIRTPESLTAVTGAPNLGRIPNDPKARTAPLVVGEESRSIRAEVFRQIRTNLQFVSAEQTARVIVVTSSVPGEGKSSTATNLAITFARAGKRALLIEADLRRPRVADYLGLERAVGLTNILAGQVRLGDVVQTWGSDGLEVLASGPIPPNPSELLGSTAMEALLAEARESFDIVIIDTPPLLPVTDAAIAAASADGAVIVARYGKTRYAEAERCAESLRAVDARILGTILNRAPARGVDGHRYDRYEYDTDQPMQDLGSFDPGPAPASGTDTRTAPAAAPISQESDGRDSGVVHPQDSASPTPARSGRQRSSQPKPRIEAPN